MLQKGTKLSSEDSNFRGLPLVYDSLCDRAASAGEQETKAADKAKAPSTVTRSASDNSGSS